MAPKVFLQQNRIRISHVCSLHSLLEIDSDKSPSKELTVTRAPASIATSHPLPESQQPCPRLHGRTGHLPSLLSPLDMSSCQEAKPPGTAKSKLEG